MKHRLDNNGVGLWAKEKVCCAIKELLETKHLYQNITINLSDIFESIKQVKDDPASTYPIPTQVMRARTNEIRKNLHESANHILNALWIIETETCAIKQAAVFQPSSGIVDTSKTKSRVCLPPIQIAYCNCNAILPAHNSGFKGLLPNLSPCDIQDDPVPIQILFFPYQCQSCRGEPVIFVVRREGAKLQLVGRSQFEKIVKPDYIPKTEGIYYDYAVIAFNCGHILAGLFYLRVMIEQYLRRILKNKEKISGDELCDKYALLLADDYPKERCPSMKTIYEELSLKIHAADSDANQFEKSKKDIEKHFDVLRIFPLKSQSVGNAAVKESKESGN